jgi:pyruvate/2-oxoglutarate dehydrogenase complex dihydrolipoamide dehydrogenase (E3) component
MAEALASRGLAVTQLEQLPEVLPTVDPELGELVHAELDRHGVEVRCHTRVEGIAAAPPGSTGRLEVRATGPEDRPLAIAADLVLVVVGVRRTPSLPPPPEPSSASRGRSSWIGGCASPRRRVRRRRLRDHPRPTPRDGLRPSRHHRPQAGQVAGENALGGSREFAGSLATQVVKVFDLVAARTGLCDHEASGARFEPVTVASTADDQKAYYPGSHPIAMRYTGDRRDGRLLGVQLVGHRSAEVAKRIDIPATAIFNEMTVETLRSGPVVHPSAGLAVGRPAAWCASVDTRGARNGRAQRRRVGVAPTRRRRTRATGSSLRGAARSA